MELIDFASAAALVGVPDNILRQWVRDGSLLILRDEDGRRQVPKDFLAEGDLVKGLAAVVTLLRDAGYRDDEIIDWLYREDDTLPGTPINALRENRGTEVKRRAQASGF